jgi:hypothetical protein
VAHLLGNGQGLNTLVHTLAVIQGLDSVYATARHPRNPDLPELLYALNQ